MADVSWSRFRDEDCVRVRGAAPDARIRVRAGSAKVVGELPPMAGRVVHDGDDLCFVPRFPFVGGTTYTVAVDGAAAATLVRPRVDSPPGTEVVAIHPTATRVPRNLLRCYVSFSAPMSEGDAARHVGLVDDDGETMLGALLPTEHELWDAERRRLTVLLDPARIKRGLAGHRQLGYPLRPGEPFRFVVDEGFRDATGRPLRAPANRRYEVGDDERRLVDAHQWSLDIPASGTTKALIVEFDRPLDHALLARCLRVLAPDGTPVAGTPHIGPEERSWRFSPLGRWASAPHRLVIDPVLEDVAGNSVSRVFDRDLTQQGDRTDGSPIWLAFEPR
jgi:hypothetical protein